MKNKPKLPQRGISVRGSQTGQPIMLLFDLIGRRWSMGVLWNLSTQNRTFRDLQACCGSASPTVLNTRLKELRAVDLVEKTGVTEGTDWNINGESAIITVVKV